MRMENDMTVKEVEKHILAEKLNELIKTAINYGGDNGGPYYGEQDLKPLVCNMRSIIYTSLGGFEVVITNDIPMFAKVLREDEEDLA